MPIIKDRKSRLLDYLNNFRFHVLDVSFSTPTVLNLGYGFRSVTMPEVQIETKDVKEGTFEYRKSFVLGAAAQDIILEQGVSIFNSDFYDWASSAIRGTPNHRRNLLIIQFSDATLIGPGGVGTGKSPASIGLGPFNIINFNDLIGRVPARAWLAKECIPVGYKAGSDLDALGSDISIAQLTVRPRYWDEINLGI